MVDGEGIDGCRPRWGGGWGGGRVAVDGIGVGDVEGIEVGGESDAVGTAEGVGYGADVACCGIEAVDELGELGFWSETLFVAVDGVCEPDGAVGVDDDVIRGIEGAGVVVV